MVSRDRRKPRFRSSSGKLRGSELEAQTSELDVVEAISTLQKRLILAFLICLLLSNGGTDWVRTSDLALMKPAGIPTTTTNQAVIDEFVGYKKATKGLTPRGEQWLRDMTGRFIQGIGTSVTDVGPQQIVAFLAPYSDRPFQRHGLYRALKSLYRWLKKMRRIPENPMEYIEAPKVPDKILNMVTPEQASILIENAACTRDKAVIGIFADTGARRSEVCNIRVRDIDLERNRIKVTGKGDKEGYLIFGAKTKCLIIAHLSENEPDDYLFDLNFEGIKTMLRRLGDKTGIKARPHDFRRGFATSLRKSGVGELDIQQLGRWSSLEMVRRYTKAFTFDDAAERYKPIVT